MKRRQFPIRPCFAMTINKAQSRSINNLGVYLPKAVFSHGQLYVALSRAELTHRTKVMLTDVNDTQGPIQNNDGKYTTNAVYNEVLN